MRLRVGALSLAMLAAGAFLVRDRLPVMLNSVEGRRLELAATDRMRSVVVRRANELAGRADRRELLVFVTAWPWERGGVYIYPTFLNAEWARLSFARLYGCTAPRNCPAVTFIPNFPLAPTVMSIAERKKLCDRIARADVLVVRSEPFIPEPMSHPQDPGACDAWLQSIHAVQFPEMAVR
jgi:hypothetical protein